VTNVDIFALLPLIVLASTATVVMLSLAFYRSHLVSVVLTLLGITVSFATLINAYSVVPRHITRLLILDQYACFFIGLTLAASFIVVVLSYGYLKKCEESHEEYYVLMLLALLGAGVLISSNHFASLFLGLEILSVSLYVLIAYLRSSNRCVEAGIKYLILAAASSAVLLFGMALVYAELGTLSISHGAGESMNTRNIFATAGTTLIIAGVGFKLAAVPFHMWTPDVYEGAPAPVTAFIATVSKGAVFALLLRYFSLVDIRFNSPLFLIFSLIAIASMFVGNILALQQTNVKRILACSSIAHIGYLFVAFLAAKMYAFSAVSFYLSAYTVTTLGAFGVITVLSGGLKEADSIDDYYGMAYRRPWLSGVFIATLLSLAGIPTTAGFIGKFYVLQAGIGSSLWLLVVMLTVNSAIGLFYYLRIVSALFKKTVKDSEAIGSVSYQRISLPDTMTLALLTFSLVLLGVYPGAVIDVIYRMVAKTMI
jgi:NADH-quinone oxidoreductase subunit N